MSTRTLSFGRRKIQIAKDSFDGGGQGKVFHATDASTGKPAIYKILERPDDKSADGKKRLAHVIEQQIALALPQVAAPIISRDKNGEFGYLTLKAPGVALDQDKPRRFPERLEIAWILACHWSRLEAIGFAHGDISHSNIMITPDGDVWLIDTDGFAASDPFVPKPTMIGQHPYLAPEIRRARNSKSPRPADLNTDRFAWAVLLSCVLLNRHPTEGLRVETPAKFDKAMTTGQWPDRRRKARKGETPIAALGADLPKLFDRAFTNDPASTRPSANEWRSALDAALQNMTQHNCGHVFVHQGNSKCPWCTKKIRGSLQPSGARDALKISLRGLRTGATAEFTLQRGTKLILGRGNIPDASGYVSGEHLLMAIVGSDLLIENLGRNGTQIAVSGRYSKPLTRLLSALPCTGLSGAHLLLADTQVAFKVSAH